MALSGLNNPDALGAKLPWRRREEENSYLKKLREKNNEVKNEDGRGKNQNPCATSRPKSSRTHFTSPPRVGLRPEAQSEQTGRILVAAKNAISVHSD